MNISRKISAFVLLLVYSVVFVHGMVPHHHHYESPSKCVDNVILPDSESIDHCCKHSDDEKESFLDFADDTHQHHHCHFEVQPVLTKVTEISVVYLLSIELEHELLLETLSVACFEYNSLIKHQFFHTSIPSRGPPFFA